MQITSVKINGMHNVDSKEYILGEGFTYLYGLNGVGKTTVLQAIQLALLGYIPGTNKNKTDIFKHASKSTMSVKVNISGAGHKISVTRTYTQTSKEIVATCDIVPAGFEISSLLGELSLPVCDFNEFMSMTSNKLKDWFINFLPSSDGDIEWNQVLRKEIASISFVRDPEFIAETVKYANSLPKGLEGVRMLNEHLKQSLSFKKNELTRVQSTIESLIFYDDCDDSLDINDIKVDIHNNTIERDSLNKLSALVHQNTKTLEAINAIHTAADSIEEDAQYYSYKQLLDTNNPKLMNILADIRELELENSRLSAERSSKANIIKDEGICPYSKSKCQSIVDMIANLTDEVNAANETIIRNNTQLMKLVDEKQALTASNTTAVLYINAAEADYPKREALKAQLSVEASEINIEEVTAKIDALTSAIDTSNQLISKIEANNQYNKLIEVISAQKYQVEQDMDMLKAWIKLTDVNGLQSQMMVKPFEQLASRMTSYLQQLFENPDVSASFVLTAKANSFDFGMNINNTFLKFELLSSGQQCMYTLALLLSIIESSESPLHLLLVDDLLDHLDNHRIEAVFNVMDSVETVQILMAGVHASNHPNWDKIAINIS